MQLPADSSISNPTRLAIVNRLRAAGDATLDDLAESANVHRNTVRAHVEALEEAGLIERTTSPPRGVGRPRVRYRLTPAARAVEPPPLARLLGAALGDSGLSQPQARRLARLRASRAKRRRGRRRVAAEIEGRLADLGFRARVTSDAVELDQCPCPLVAGDNPAVVCALVAGTVDGTLERLGADERVTASSHDPAARRCTLRLGL